jgi:hypothetical protein
MKNILFVGLLLVILGLFMIPLYLFWRRLQSRIENIYGLIVSIKGDDLKSEISIEANILVDIEKSLSHREVNIQTFRKIDFNEVDQVKMNFISENSQHVADISPEIRVLLHENYHEIRKR